MHQVLVVEDDPATRHLIERLVTSERWDVAVAESGRVALERVAAQTPDLILLDLMMPEMDGFEFVVQIQKNPAWRAIPIVVVTAKDLDASERQRLNGHVEKILQKGAYSHDELFEEICQQVAVYAGRS